MALAQLDDYTRAVEVVWLLGRGKTWLRESAGWIIVEAVQALARSNAAWKDDGFRWLAGRVCEAKEVGPESIAIMVALKSAAPSLLASTTLPHLASPDLLASANLAALARILKDGAGEDESAQNIASGAGRTQAHFVWDLLLREYLCEEGQAAATWAPFADTYRVLVDEALFSSSASDQKKSWGFQVFEKALEMANAEDLQSLFTPNLMRSWMNQLADKNRMLHKAAQRCVSKMQTNVRKTPAVGFTIISQLVGKHGSVRFDAITSTKTVESLLSCMDAAGVRRYVDYLLQLASQNASDDKESMRKWSLDQLLLVVRNASIARDDDCVGSILSFLAAHGFFSVKAALEAPSSDMAGLSVLPVPPFSSATKSVCRVRFFSCLGELSDQNVTHIDAQGKSRRAQGQTTKGQSWVSQAFALMEVLERDSKHFSPLYWTAVDNAVSRGRAFIERLSKAKDKADKDQTRAKMQDFQSMVLAGMLYSRRDLSHDEASEAGLVDATIECGSRLVLGKKAKEGEPSAMELFVHCQVTFLEKSSAFLRTVATQAFASFADEMDRASLEQLLDVSNSVGCPETLSYPPVPDQQLGFNDASEVDASEAVEGMDNMEDADGDEEEDEVMSDSISETSATSASTSGDTVDPILVAKLQEVLKESGAADSDAASSADESSSDTSSKASEFDDDQMLLIDDKLADIFRQRLGSRREEAEAKKETVALHIKILDLLDVYARKQSSNPLCVQMILPLFTIALEKDATLDQLKQRAVNVLTKTLCKSKDAPSGVLPAQTVLAPMEAVHKMAASKLAVPLLNLCSLVNVYLTRACKAPEQFEGPIRALYLATLDDFVQRKSSNLRPQFFLDVFQRLPTLGFSLRNELLAAATGVQASPKQSYRQLQALEILRTVLVQLASIGKEKEQLVAFLPLVSEAILSTVANQKLRLKEIIKVALDLARLSKKVCASAEEVARIWPAQKIEEVVEALGGSQKLANSASLQSLLRQLLAITTASANVKRKNADDSSTPKKKRTNATS